METLLQTVLFHLVGYLETQLPILGDVFFPYQKINWLLIAEKYLKLPTHLASRCVCEVPGDEGSTFLGAAVTQLRLCKYKLEWNALSPVYLQWSFSPVTSSSGNFICVVLEFLSLFDKKCPPMHVSMWVWLKSQFFLEMLSAFDQCCLPVNSLWFFSTATWNITAWQKWTVALSMVFPLCTSCTWATTPSPASTPMAGASARSCTSCKLVSVVLCNAGRREGSKEFPLYQPVETQQLQAPKWCPCYLWCSDLQSTWLKHICTRNKGWNPLKVHSGKRPAEFVSCGLPVFLASKLQDLQLAM